MNDWGASLIHGSVTYPRHAILAASVNPHRALTDTERGIVFTLIDMAAERSPAERANAVLRSLDSAGYEIVRKV